MPAIPQLKKERTPVVILIMESLSWQHAPHLQKLGIAPVLRAVVLALLVSQIAPNQTATMSTFAEIGFWGYRCETGVAASAQISCQFDLDADGQNNLYFMGRRRGFVAQISSRDRAFDSRRGLGSEALTGRSVPLLQAPLKVVIMRVLQKRYKGPNVEL
jgi:hypothetical protein